MYFLVSIIMILFANLLIAQSSSKNFTPMAECECGNGIQEAFPQNFANPDCPFKLYGSTILTPNTQSVLYGINTFNGDATEIGPIETSSGMALNRVSSLDFSPEGVLYGIGQGTSGSFDNKSLLLTLDCKTATATIIADIGIEQKAGKAFTDMNFNQYGELYVFLKDSQPNMPNFDKIGTMNVASGQFSEIGEPMLSLVAQRGNGISFADFAVYPQQTLYHMGDFIIATLDLMTGQGTSIHMVPFPQDPINNRPRANGIDIDYLTNTVYASFNDRPSGTFTNYENYIGIIDFDAGNFSFLKMPVEKAVNGLTAMAFNRPYEECDDGTPIPPGCECGEDCLLDESDCSDGIDNDFDGLIDCADSDCDGKACLRDDECFINATCSEGMCSGGSLKDCDDMESCTDDSCHSDTGFCINEPDETNSCDDANQCTTDSCTIDGECSSTNVSDGTSCDTGECFNETCTSGECTCDPVTEDCSNSCDDDCDGLIDGNDPDCISGEICDDGIDNDGDGDIDCADSECTDGTTCESDGNPCTDDVCSSGTCTHPDDDTNSCDDGNECTDDTCSSGTCVGTNDDTNTCSDGNVCTDNTCSSGSCMVSSNNTDTCDDSDPCTENDTCDGTGTCSGEPIVCEDNNECTSDFCDEGACQHVPLSDGTICTDDGNQCTDDTCQDGVCTHTNDDTNTCDDGRSCTSGDSCNAGECEGTPGTEDCDNGIDDDCDNDIDEFDADCFPLDLRVFITSDVYDGDLGGLSGADSICQSTADSQSLGGTWVAMLSDSTTNAIDRLINCNDIPWFLLSGTPNEIAADKADLFDGDIQQAINVDETGAHVGDAYVWTGTDPDGTVTPTHCEDWTTVGMPGSGRAEGVRGSAEHSDSRWTNFQSSSCQQERHLYCFEIDTSCP